MKARACTDGVREYRSITEMGLAHGITPSLARYRCDSTSDEFSKWQFLAGPSPKKIYSRQMKALVDRLKDGPATTSELSRITGWTNTELWGRLSCFEDQGRVKHRTRGRGRGSSTTWWLASNYQAPQPPDSAIIYLGAVIIALAALSLGVVLRNGVIDALEGTLIEGADGAGVP